MRSTAPDWRLGAGDYIPLRRKPLACSRPNSVACQGDSASWPSVSDHGIFGLKKRGAPRRVMMEFRFEKPAGSPFRPRARAVFRCNWRPAINTKGEPVASGIQARIGHCQYIATRSGPAHQLPPAKRLGHRVFLKTRSHDLDIGHSHAFHQFQPCSANNPTTDTD